MSPTPEIPVPPVPLPDDLAGWMQDAPAPMTPEVEQRIHDAITAPTNANLDAMLGNVTSPWLTFAWTALTIATLLAVAALALIVWRTRGGDAKTRYQRQVREDADRRREALRLEDHRARREAAVREGFTFTPADTDDVPPAPVNLDEER